MRKTRCIKCINAFYQMGAPIPIYHYFVCKHKFVVPCTRLFVVLAYTLATSCTNYYILHSIVSNQNRDGQPEKIRRFSFGVPLFWPHFFMNLRFYNNNEFIQLFEPRSPLSTHVNKAHLLLHPSHARIILASLGCYVLLTVFRAYQISVYRSATISTGAGAIYMNGNIIGVENRTFGIGIQG